MSTVKCTTEHLICLFTKDGKGQPYYQIWDMADNSKPLLIYVNAHTIHIANEIVDVTEHPYYEEMCDIVERLAVEEYERNKKGGII